MSLTPEALDAMRAAGLTAEQIVAVVKADMVAEQAKQAAAEAERRAVEEERKAKVRASNRERQARWRERNANNAHNGVTTCDERYPSPKENNQTPTQNISPSDPVGSSAPKGARRPRKHALPADWQPGAKSDAARRELGRSVEWMHGTVIDMRSWAEGKGEIRADWDATHVGWMRREAKRECSSGPPPPRGSPVAKPRFNNPFFAGLDEELRDDRERFADPEPFRPRLAAGGRH